MSEQVDNQRLLQGAYWRDCVWRFHLLVGCLAAAMVCLAVDKSGVTPHAVSRPSGPGSIEGLGAAFEPMLSAGTGSYALPLVLPPNAGGHVPTLVLSYDGGNGNGPLGIGWRLEVPFVQRRTHKGIPRYVDGPNGIDDDEDGEIDEADECDVFIGNDKEELVAVPNADAEHTDYFRRHEGAFIRYRRVGDGWEGRLPDGTLLEFGLTEAARLTDESGSRIFKWMLERSTDTHGNAIVYLYETVADAHNTNQVYLSEIRYGPGTPDQRRFPRSGGWSDFHLLYFEYEARPDWFEDCRAGFVVRTGRRLKRIVVGTQGPDLSKYGHAEGDINGDGQRDFLNRALLLSYDGDPHWSLLTSITPVGADDSSVLPPLTFTYTTAVRAATVSAAGAVIGSENAPLQVMDLAWVDLLDFNGDGLPDILYTDPLGGPHRIVFNRGEVDVGGLKSVHWSRALDVGGDARAWSVNLADDHGAIAHLADINADGVSDLVVMTDTDTYCFINQPSATAPAWGPRGRMQLAQDGSAPPPAFGSADVRTADLNFDKRMDIIQSLAVAGGATYRVWLNLDGERYGRGVTVAPEHGFMFSDVGVHLADMNGDRIPDMVRIKASELWITPGLGYGRFGPLISVDIPDWTLTPEQLQRAVLEDCTGDGLADLVIERAAPGQLWAWANLGNYTLDKRSVVTNLPAQFGTAPVRRWADINGNGTVDVIYADRDASPRIQAVDIGRLLGCVPTPHLLTGIDNGVGRQIAITYETSTRMMLADAAQGTPWPDPLPFPVDVVTGVTVDDTRGNLTTATFEYHAGYYDAGERLFGGFSRVVQTDHGDASAPTLVSRFLFHTGKGDLAMKGKLLESAVEQEDGALFHAEATSWTTRLLYSGADGRLVRFAHPVSSIRRVPELGRGEPRRIESEYDYDDYGNAIALREYGIVEEGDRAAFADERITETEFAYNLEHWLVRFPMRRVIRDLGGGLVSRTETYYDDPSFSGTNLGTVSAGLPTLIRRWIDPDDDDAFVDAVRKRYDAHGNPVVFLDPLAAAPGGIVDDSVGHYRTVAYDDSFHTYPVLETIHLEGAKADLVLSAAYNPGLGVVTSSSEPDGHGTSYAYDPFGRLIRIYRPGDDPGYPSVEYQYVLGHDLGPQYERQQGGAPRPMINWLETRRLDQEPGSQAVRADHYLISRTFVDGLGRTVMSKSEAEDDPETGLPRVVGEGAIQFNARGEAARILNPFYTQLSGDLDAQLGFEEVTAPGWQGSFQDGASSVVLDLAAAHAIEIFHDATLRKVRTRHPDGSTAEIAYEPFGVIFADENDSDPASPYRGTPTLQWSDGLGRLVRLDERVRLDDDGHPSPVLQTWTTHYRYRADGRLTAITDSQNNRKAFDYDGLGRITMLRDLDRGTMRYAYDKASNLLRTTDAREQTIAYSYDGANRLLSETYATAEKHIPDSPAAAAKSTADVLYHYDTPAAAVDAGNGSRLTAANTRGRLAWVRDGSGEEHTSYDRRGRETWVVKRIVDPLNGALQAYKTAMTHDPMDRIVDLIYPDEDRCTYRYNRRGLLERITGGAAANAAGSPWIIRSIAYAASGQAVATRYGNGVQTIQGYDNRLRLDELHTFRSLEDKSGDQSPESDLLEAETPSLQVAAEDRRSETASHIGPRRASKSQPPQAGGALIHNAYTFDRASNITRIDDRRPGAAYPEGDPRRNTQVLQYDDLYRLTNVQYSFALPGQADRDGGWIAYRYDRIGNMVSKVSGMDHRDPRSGLSVTHLGAMAYGGPAGAWNRMPRQGTDPPGPHALTHCDAENRVYAYDANGNMSTVDGLVCTWDVKDRLTAVEDVNMRAEYAYDYSGRRVWKRVWDKQFGEPSATSPSTAAVYVNRTFEIRAGDQPTKIVFDGSTRVAEVTGSLDVTRQRLQRIRVHPGWNLIVLTVDAEDAAVQLLNAGGDAPAVTQAFRWNAAAEAYRRVEVGDALPAGSILWVCSDHAGILHILGAYAAAPEASPAAGAGQFTAVGSATLRTDCALSTAWPRIWLFDAGSQAWRRGDAGASAFLSDLPRFLPAGCALFVMSSTCTTLPGSDAAVSIRYIHQDHLGSTAIMTDAHGAVLDEIVNYPFGYARRHERPEPARCLLPATYGLTQKEQDHETGLHYVEARYLASMLGRFVSVDPLVQALTAGETLASRQLNAYSYALSNPLRLVDTTGLRPRLVEGFRQGENTTLDIGGGVCHALTYKWLERRMQGTQTDLRSLEAQAIAPQRAFVADVWAQAGGFRGANRGDQYRRFPAPSGAFTGLQAARETAGRYMAGWLGSFGTARRGMRARGLSGDIDRLAVGEGLTISMWGRAGRRYRDLGHEYAGHTVGVLRTETGLRFMDPNRGEFEFSIGKSGWFGKTAGERVGRDLRQTYARDLFDRKTIPFFDTVNIRKNDGP